MVVAAMATLSGCAQGADTAVSTSTSPTSTTAAVPTPTIAPAPVAPAPRTVNWFDLDVGDCLVDPPPEDPNVIAVPVVDCTAAHLAEVYLRVPMAVNTALADVADRDCSAGFTGYTGQSIGDSPYTTSYLIDSNQNRTSSNPDPSTVICLLQPADGRPLTASARR